MTVRFLLWPKPQEFSCKENYGKLKFEATVIVASLVECYEAINFDQFYHWSKGERPTSDSPTSVVPMIFPDR